MPRHVERSPTPRPSDGPRLAIDGGICAGDVDPQLGAVLEIIERNDPDVLLVNEFDTGTDGDSGTVRMFAE
ncbi:MAG: hypothetical protein H0V69_16160, partial [Acidimicrobiia bacterium]|nr:hypothetical protein [Acidimicrobiia bacterium]